MTEKKQDSVCIMKMTIDEEDDASRILLEIVDAKCQAPFKLSQRKINGWENSHLAGKIFSAAGGRTDVRPFFIRCRLAGKKHLTRSIRWIFPLLHIF